VHGCGGAVGVLAAGLATERRLAVPQPYPSYGGVGKQLPIQIAFVLFVGALSAALGYSFLRVLMWSSEYVFGTSVRVGRVTENEGLDTLYLLEEKNDNMVSTDKCVVGGREATFVVEQYAANSPIEDRFHVRSLAHRLSLFEWLCRFNGVPRGSEPDDEPRWSESGRPVPGVQPP
jgi:hypothetical protein